MRTELMAIEYTGQDFLSLAVILEKYDNNIDTSPWLKFMKEWITEYDTMYIIELIIDCYFIAYDLSDIEKLELKEIICHTPIYLLGQYSSDISVNNPKGIFTTWRLEIHK